MGFSYKALDRRGNEELYNYDSRISSMLPVVAGYVYFDGLNYNGEAGDFNVYIKWEDELNGHMNDRLPETGFFVRATWEQADELLGTGGPLPVYIKLISVEGRIFPYRKYILLNGRPFSVEYNGSNAFLVEICQNENRRPSDNGKAGNNKNKQGVLTGSRQSVIAGSQQSTLTGNQRSILAGSQQSTLTGSQRSMLAGSQQSTLTGNQRSILTGSQQSMLTGSQRSILAGSRQSMLTGSQRNYLAGSQQSTLTGSQQSMLTGSQRNYLAGSQQSMLTGSQRSILAGSQRGRVANTEYTGETVCPTEDYTVIYEDNTFKVVDKDGYASENNSRIYSEFPMEWQLINRSRRPEGNRGGNGLLGYGLDLISG